VSLSIKDQRFQTGGPPQTIIVADDDLEVRDYFESALKTQGYFVRLAENGEEVLDYLEERSRPASLVLLDVIMPGKGGMETYQEISRIRGDLPVILVSGTPCWPEQSNQFAVPIARFLEKPVMPDKLFRTVAETLRDNERVPVGSAQVNAATLRSCGPILARSVAMRKIDAVVRQIGPSDVPVLLQGETGVGKEVLARQLHAHSSRAHLPFLKLNCAALPPELVESELFGYRRGAFTGAFKDSPGKFEMAQGGAILLDEIGDMEVRLQAKLLQVLQDGEFQRLGSGETVRVDVRIMAATHRDLRKAIREGRFREDLFYRLNVISIQVPALRERKDEILCLAEYFLDKHRVRGVPALQIGPELHDTLLAYDWPGNVRELENIMRKYLVLRREDDIIAEVQTLAATSFMEQSGTQRCVLDEVKNKAELEVTLDALKKTQWNRKQAARLLNMDYKVFLYRIKKLGIEGKKGLTSA